MFGTILSVIIKTKIIAGLTTEYLDQILDKKFNEFKSKIDNKLAKLTQELKDFTEQQVGSLAVIVQRSIVV